MDNKIDDSAFNVELRLHSQLFETNRKKKREKRKKVESNEKEKANIIV